MNTLVRINPVFQKLKNTFTYPIWHDPLARHSTGVSDTFTWAL